MPDDIEYDALKNTPMPVLDERIRSLVKKPSTPPNGLGLPRVFSAAVVDKDFCNTLLTDPAEALKRTCLGEPFILSEEERMLLTIIRADSLPDLARQANQAQRIGT